MDSELDLTQMFLDETYHENISSTRNGNSLSSSIEDEHGSALLEILHCLVCNAKLEMLELESQSQCRSLSSPLTLTVTLEEKPANNLSLATLCQVFEMPNVSQFFSEINRSLLDIKLNKKGYTFENSNLFCKSCKSKISDATILREELKNLQSRQQAIICDLRKSILTCYDAYDQDCRIKFSALNYQAKMHHVVRKTFSQCWTDCRVPIRKLKVRGIQRFPILSNKIKTPSNVNYRNKTKCVLNSAKRNSRLKNCKRQLPQREGLVDLDLPSTFQEDAPTIIINDNDFNTIAHKELQNLDLTHSQRSRENCTDNVAMNPSPDFEAEGRSGQHTNLECDAFKSCDRILSNKTDLKVHNNPQCQVSSANAKNSTKQKQIDWPNECKHCGKEFSDKEVTITADNTTLFTCDLPNCTKKFKSFGRLKSHHDSTCPTKLLNKKLLKREGLSCDVLNCNKKFELQTALRNHRLSVHEQKFNYFCEECGHGTLTQSMLKRHMIVHSTEKSVQCEECGYRCKRPSQLFYHKRLHTNELPHLCFLCGKGFRSNNKLQQHMASHAKSKDFPCPLCPKYFASKTYVTNHINSFHKKVPRKVNPNANKSRRKERTLPNQDISYADIDISHLTGTAQPEPVPEQIVSHVNLNVPTLTLVKEFNYDTNNIPLINHIFVHVTDHTALANISQTHQLKIEQDDMDLESEVSFVSVQQSELDNHLS